MKKTFQAASVAALLAAGSVYLFPERGWQEVQDEAHRVCLGQWRPEENGLSQAAPTVFPTGFPHVTSSDENYCAKVFFRGLVLQSGLPFVLTLSRTMTAPAKGTGSPAVDLSKDYPSTGKTAVTVSLGTIAFTLLTILSFRCAGLPVLRPLLRGSQLTHAP